MPGFDELAPDQKAVLQLLLKQGKTYDDIAGLLRLERANVRERALDALDALGADKDPAAGGLSSERQDELADHLLLQQTASERASTRQFLEGSAPGRAWARGVANELRPVGGDALPEIPAEPAEVAEAFGALDERTAARERQQQSSRLGGVLILLAIGAVIGLGILLLIRGGGNEEEETAAQGTQSTATDGPTGTTGTGAGAAGFPQQQINLNPPEGGDDNALGFALIAEGGLALQAEGLPQSDLYGVYLYNSRSEALPLGFAAYDRASKRLSGAITTLPEEASGFRNVVITKQSGKGLETPGKVVLRGAIKRG